MPYIKSVWPVSIKYRASRTQQNEWMIEFRLWWLPMWIKTPIVFATKKEAQLYCYEMNKDWEHESIG